MKSAVVTRADPVSLERSLHILRPAVIMTTVWVITITAWLTPSATRFQQLTGAERRFSLISLAFIASCVFLFWAGSLIARSHPPFASQPGRDQLWWVVRPPLRTCRQFALFSLLLGGSAVLFTVYRSASSVGGASTLLGEFQGGNDSWGYLTSRVVDPATVQGISTWVHALTAVAPLTAIGVYLSDGKERVQFAAIGGTAFVLVLIQAIIHSERTTAFQYPILFVLTYFLVSTLCRPPGGELRRLVTLVSALLALLALFWTVSEVKRQLDPSVSVTTNRSTSFAGDRFVAYLGANANNLSYLIQTDTNPSYAFYLAKGAVTTLHLDSSKTPVVGAAVVETSRALRELYGSEPLTTFSAIGDVYRDLLWASAGVFLILGFIVTKIWLAAVRGSFVCVMVYPLCVVSLVLSFQVFHWSETPFLIPIIILALSSLKARRADVRTQRPVSLPGQVLLPPRFRDGRAHPSR